MNGIVKEKGRVIYELFATATVYVIQCTRVFGFDESLNINTMHGPCKPYEAGLQPCGNLMKRSRSAGHPVNQ